jgi:hypothetical protein
MTEELDIERGRLLVVSEDEPNFVRPCIGSVPLNALDDLKRPGLFRLEVRVRAKDSSPTDFAVECTRLSGRSWDNLTVQRG